MDATDVANVAQTALVSIDITFTLGRQRVATCLFLQMGFITANRPQAILEIRYRHIVVTRVRDPQGGPTRTVLEFSYEFTKQFLGMKETYGPFADPSFVMRTDERSPISSTIPLSSSVLTPSSSASFSTTEPSWNRISLAPGT